MNNNMSMGIDLICEYDILKPSFKFIVNNNSANCAPYHNIGHLLKVLGRCDEGAEYHGIKDSERDELMLAALWHDYGHSEGRFSDTHNVALAISEVIRFLDDNPIEGVDPNNVSNIIKATEYPYVLSILSMRQGIIRDADLMMCLEDDWFQTVILGLQRELSIDIKDMIAGQAKFIENAEMNTEWGKEIKRRDWSQGLENLKKIKEIYNYDNT